MRKLFVILNIFIISLLASCTSEPRVDYMPIFALETKIDVTFYNVLNSDVHFKEIKKIYNNVNRVASDFESNSKKNSVYDLNLNREIIADDLLVDMVKEALVLMEETNGYFNPFIGRLSHLWKDSINNTKIPLSDEVIESELSIMNNTSLTIDGNKISLNGYGNLDLGGMAKGYATELCKEYLDSVGVSSYIIDAGHSNIVFGDKIGEDFKIGLSSPIDNKIVSVIKGKNLAIGTSSFEHQSFIHEGIRYHHLISPFTGKPSNYYDSVSVIMDDSTRCDVYSTALYGMDLESIEKLDIRVILIKDNKVIYTNCGDLIGK